MTRELSASRASTRRATGRRRGLWILLGLVIGLWASPGGVWASEAKKKKVIRLETITVEGRIQKPQAFYILQRSNLNFDELERTESFLPKVVKSVEREPF